MRIRDAGPEDAAAVVALVQEQAAEDGEASPLDEAFARGYLAGPERGVLLAVEEGESIGLLSYSVRPDLFHAGGSALIEELLVRAPYRGKGVGTVLVRTLLERLEGLGCAEVSVTTMPDNRGAIRFYRQLGLAEEAIYLEKHFESANGGQSK
jgi:ribosomal protein S18 acetylase RimI-like enzyme